MDQFFSEDYLKIEMQCMPKEFPFGINGYYAGRKGRPFGKVQRAEYVRAQLLHKSGIFRLSQSFVFFWATRKYEQYAKSVACTSMRNVASRGGCFCFPSVLIPFHFCRHHHQEAVDGTRERQERRIDGQSQSVHVNVDEANQWRARVLPRKAGGHQGVPGRIWIAHLVRHTVAGRVLVGEI